MVLRQQHGFTLLEILITLAVSMLIISSGYLVIPNQLLKARDSRRKTDLKKVTLILEEFYNDSGYYPNKLPDCNQPLMSNQKVILKSLPCDPLTGESYGYYSKKDDHQSFSIYTKLENISDPDTVALDCQAGCGPDCGYNYGLSSSNAALTRCSYVCAPGGGKTGACELFENANLSQCPKMYFNDSSCANECSVVTNRCSNSSGKNLP